MPEEIKVKTVTKRSGHTENFDPERILRAITKANLETGEMDESIIPDIVAAITASLDTHVTVETIQDIVEKEIAKAGYFDTAKAYILYRDKRRRQREGNDYLMGELYHQLLFTDSKDMDLKRDNANVNTEEPMGIMLKLGTEGSKSYCSNYAVPEEFMDPHKEGIVHIHDLDFSLICPNCATLNLGKLFKNGFSTGHGHLREPGSIRSAASLACIAIQSNQNQMLGGQAIGAFDFVMAPYVHKSFQKHLRKAMNSYNKFFNTWDISYLNNPRKKEEYDNIFNSIRYYEEGHEKRKGMPTLLSFLYVGRKEEDFKKVYDIACKELEDETHQAMEALVHNFNTLHSRAGKILTAD